MWDGFFLLLLLCLLMGTMYAQNPQLSPIEVTDSLRSSFLVGSLPLTLNLTTRQLRLVTAFGIGILVGTSLVVIIPEGVETLYNASERASPDDFLAARFVRRTPSSVQCEDFAWSQDEVLGRGEKAPVIEGPRVSKDSAAIVQDFVDSVIARSAQGEMSFPADTNNEVEMLEPEPIEEELHSKLDPHSWVGFSIVTGFILMYVIDTLPKQIRPSGGPQRFHVSLNQFSLHRNSTSSQPLEPETISMNGDYAMASADSHSQASRPSSTTIGLVIHAAADGIALGASSTTTSRLSFIIFIALLIHKAPAAFGLTSALLKQGLNKRIARTHLIVFSLAAPAGALLTWAAAHLIGNASSESSSIEFTTGVLLLFSGGTFLYVAMHTMQEGSSAHAEHTNGYAAVPLSVYGEPQPQALPKDEPGLIDTMVTVAGMLLPLLTQFGHAH